MSAMSTPLSRLRQLLRALTVPLVLLALLEAWARSVGAGSDTLAPPSAAASALLAALSGPDLWQATGFTLSAAGLGLALGAAGGMALGIPMGLLPGLARVGFLSVEVLRPVPSVALIPLAMLVFGFGLRMEVSVVAFATFWPILVLAQAAARQVEPQLLEVAAALELSPWARLRQVILPAMVPRLFVALRLGVAIALVVAVTVEIAANPNGMGYAIMIAQQSFDPPMMLAWLFWIGLVGYAINALALALQRRVARQMGEAA